MARRGRGWASADPRAGFRTARVGALIRQIVAEGLERLDDERLGMVSVTAVEVDRDLHRAVVWFTTLDGDDDSDLADALEEHAPRLRRAVGRQSRLRKTPQLVFRPDIVLRSAEHIEKLIANSTSNAISTATASTSSSDHDER